LSSHFEAGRSETGFYDFFVHDGEPADRVFDRDKWWLSQPGDEAVVWTLRFATSWSELREIINREKWWKLPFHRPPYLGLNIRRPFDWALTRFLGQMGGLIRPRHYWRASVPKRFTLAAKGREAFELGMRGMTGPMFDPDANDNGRWPLVIPSAAVKREFIGVENLRADSNCQVFLFEHGTSRITGFYRRKLWPEPSEDPLYGALWQLGASQSFQAYAWNEFPAIDDVAEGLLDRGYRLDAEEPSNGRAVADLMRCQAEDAAENIAFGTPAARDYLYKMTAEMFGENFRAAGLSAIRGLRLAPDNPDLLQGLSQCFEKLQKPGWAERTLSRALTIDPNHPWLLYRQAMILTRRAQIEEASDLLDRAIQLYNAGTFEFSDFFFLELRQILAWVIGDFPNANRVSNLMTNKGYQMFEVVGQVRYLLRNHPQLVDLMQKGFACSDDPAAKFLCEFALEDLSPALGDS
jgi:tetratricopeptide (TPR) repeat protein